MNSMIQTMKKQMQDVLENNILRFWMDKMTDRKHGGYYGRMDGGCNVVETADKGAVLNARILWTFSAAYRVLGRGEYLEAARRAKQYIVEHFIDREYGGVYWSLDYQGRPKDTKKQTYAIGFTIYGMSEYARATGDAEALAIARQLYGEIEDHAYDRLRGGYVEALTREWGRIGDMRLSDKDENLSKTMNTHLHIIEPYTNLYRIWPDAGLKRQIVGLLDVFTDILMNKTTGHLDLFFDEDWNGRRNIQSFGHDIEASWLLHESALVLNDEDILRRIEPVVRQIAKAADEGTRPDGAMVYERFADQGRTDGDLHWWVQCESIVGHVNLYQYFADADALRIAGKCWAYVQSHLVDSARGEWYWSRRADGSINTVDDRAGFWKCPYHNGRMCLELIERDF